jgi:hypothetical protein
MMQPIVNGLQTEYDGRIVFEQIDANTDAGQQRLRFYGLRGHPSYTIVDIEGKALWSATGQLAEVQLRQQIDTAIQK